MDDSIAHAWKLMHERQPVRPEEIHGFVGQVHSEILAAAVGNTKIQPDSQGTIELPHGIAVKRFEETPFHDGIRSSFDLMYRGQYVVITAATTYDGGLRVRGGTEDLRTWTQEDGPQRTWLLSMLRSYVTAFLTDINKAK